VLAATAIDVLLWHDTGRQAIHTVREVCYRLQSAQLQMYDNGKEKEWSKNEEERVASYR